MEKKKFLPEISIVIIVGIVLIILAAGISYFIAVNIAGSNGNGEVVGENGEEVAPEMGETYELGEFIRNISNGDGRRMLKATIVIEVSDEEVISQIEERDTRIRDQIIDIIREQSVEDLQTRDGIDEFKGEIIDSVNDNIGDGEVINVYFEEFIIT